MRFYADLHIHSKYSRATSRNCDFEHLTLWAKRKGITVVATGDFTHPAWWQEIQDKLVPAEPGLYRLRDDLERAVDAQLPVSCRRPVRFLLEVEISTIYKKGDKTRKVHHLIYAGELVTASRFRDALGAIGNIESDGRPILGLDSRHLLEITLDSGPDAFLIPAHIWTPWFSAMGSKSGFDAIDDCYGDLAEHIFAVETGLSSDPPMNWRLSSLDRFTLVSNSDAHSPPMLGREACVFDTDLDYYAMRRALETRDGWVGTVEFFPEEGKYHLDGHRACGVRLAPEETRRHDGRCPTCGKPVTVGVLSRVLELADRDAGYVPDSPSSFRSLVPLPEIISEIKGVGPKSKSVQGTVSELTARVGPELSMLHDLPLEDVERLTNPLIAEAVARLRAGNVRCEGGFDGEFGTIRLFDKAEIVPQLTLANLFGVDDLAPFESFESRVPTAPTPPNTSVDSKLETQASTAENAAPKTLLERLDDDQRRAAEHLDGSMIIVAGPGSGKTRTLTHRLVHLLQQGVDPRHCLALTFTRRAATEMQERTAQLVEELGVDVNAGHVTISTFHSLGLELLHRYRRAAGLPRNIRIADDATRYRLIAERFGLSTAKARQACEALGEVRLDPSAADVSGAVEEPEVNAISLDDYRQTLLEQGFIDLDDLLARPVELFDHRPDLVAELHQRYRYVSVDEYQDTSPLQYRLLRHLVPPGGNLCVIGDPDQSIYRFRGADVGFFLRFEDDYPQTVRFELGRNYRSQPTIVRAAAALIRKSSLVPDRLMEPMARDAAPIGVHHAASPQAEAEHIVHGIEKMLGGTSYFSLDSGRTDGVTDGVTGVELSFEDFAILVRTRSQIPTLVEALDRAGMPVQHRTHDRLAEREDVRLLMHELYRLHDDDASLATTPALEQAAASQSLDLVMLKELLEPILERHGDDLGAVLTDLATGAQIDTWDPRAERISLMTLHAAKGLEWPVVFVAGCDEGLLPLTWVDDDAPDHDVIAEERRLFFVAMTRAEKRLILTRSRQRSWRGERRDTEPSRFLSELPDEMIEKRLTGRRRPRQRKVEQLRLL